MARRSTVFSKALVGAVNHDFDASQTIVDFFSRH